jgi:hypothetical protein
MDPIGYLGILVALLGLGGGLWSLFVHVSGNRGASDENAPNAGRSRAGLIGSALVFTMIVGLGLAIVFVALRGASGAGTEGRWHVRFEIDGGVYEGELEVRGNEGPLTVTYRGADGQSRAVEQCRLRREGQRVTIGCREPRMIQGQGTYSPDNFDLTFVNADTLQGSITSRNGTSAGSAMFVRR